MCRAGRVAAAHYMREFVYQISDHKPGCRHRTAHGRARRGRTRQGGPHISAKLHNITFNLILHLTYYLNQKAEHLELWFFLMKINEEGRQAGAAVFIFPMKPCLAIKRVIYVFNPH